MYVEESFRLLDKFRESQEPKGPQTFKQQYYRYGLSRDQLQELDGLAREAGLDVLVEVHDEAELADALTTGAELVGVNNRDLHHFTTDLATSERLKPLVPADRLMVTESGIHTAADVARMRDSGIHAFLVGEAFMREDDPGAARWHASSHRGGPART